MQPDNRRVSTRYEVYDQEVQGALLATPLNCSLALEDGRTVAAVACGIYPLPPTSQDVLVDAIAAVPPVDEPENAVVVVQNVSVVTGEYVSSIGFTVKDHHTNV